MKHRKSGTETVFYDSCGCASTGQSQAQRLREANELRARFVSVPR